MLPGSAIIWAKPSDLPLSQGIASHAPVTLGGPPHLSALPLQRHVLLRDLLACKCHCKASRRLVQTEVLIVQDSDPLDGLSLAAGWAGVIRRTWGPTVSKRGSPTLPGRAVVAWRPLVMTGLHRVAPTAPETVGGP